MGLTTGGSAESVGYGEVPSGCPYHPQDFVKAMFYSYNNNCTYQKKISVD